MEEPQYLKIYQNILNRITSGELNSGDALDPEIELTQQFNVSRVTVRKALVMLVEEGYLSRKRGKGTIVTIPDDKGGILPKEGYQEKGSLLSGVRKKLIGYILPDITSSYGMKILEGIEKEAEKLGFYLVMKLTKGDQKLEEKAIRDLLILGASGLIIFPQHGEYYNPVIMELSIKKFPFVLVDLELKGLKCSFVGTNNKEASFQALTYLINKGHKKILYLTPPVKFTSSLEDRLEGAREAFLAHNLPFPESRILSCFISSMPDHKTVQNINADKKILSAFFTGKNKVTAIFACEYHLAMMASVVLKELGLKIPEDISIVCFDCPSDYLDQYDFTHLHQSELEIGKKAMQNLNDLIEGGSTSQKTVLPVELIEGGTVRAIP